MRLRGSTGLGPLVRRLCATAAFGLFAIASSASAEEVDYGLDRPETGGYTYSLDMPPIWKGYSGFELQWFEPSDAGQLGGLANFGLFKNLGSPIVGLAAISAEGYAGWRSQDFDWGARAQWIIPTFNIGFGADYNGTDDRVSFLLRLDLPVNRGGIFGRGSMLSLRWLPGFGHTISAGITVPLWGSKIGKTRAKRDHVRLVQRESRRLEEEDVSKDLREIADTLRARTFGVARLTQPFVEQSGGNPHEAMAPALEELKAYMASTDGLFPNGHSAREEIRVYHQVLDHAFSDALSTLPVAQWESTEAGLEASRMARRYLLDYMLYPYNYLLGQRKKSDSFKGLSAVARSHFAGWLLKESGAAEKEVRAAYWMFQSLCDMMEENRAALRDRWEDARFVWLPLQYGLKPEDHDTEEEVQGIIERATRVDFQRGTKTWYVINEQFQWEIARSILAAEDYHVLWIHDIRGVNDAGDRDAITYAQVATYYKAMIARVTTYDDTGKLPMYLIFLDQHYFEINKSRLWLRVLREPLDYTVSLPSEQKDWEDRLRGLQQDLRDAIESSLLLRVQRSQYGEDWLKNRIKVHVNITNPADGSFISTHVVGIVPVPDNNMRDHRKIAFYDITEEDPYKGMVMFTGMGIGEHYVGTDWEDRALMMRGPGALGVKDAARQLVINQGFTPSQIPQPLRPLPKSKTYEQAIDEALTLVPEWLDDDYEVMQLHNQTGFRDKPINPAKAVLYSLMPDGSLLQAPDALWQNYLFASLMAGSSLRGCRSLIIAPTAESAPSAGPPTLARANGLLNRLIVFDQMMAEELEAAGGLIKVGLYAPRQGVADLAGRFRQAFDVHVPWEEKVWPPWEHKTPDPAGAIDRLLDSLGYAESYLASADTVQASPKLHLKANFFASREAWDNLVTRPEWPDVFRAYLIYLAEQNVGADTGTAAPDVRAIPEELHDRALEMVRNMISDMGPAEMEKAIAFFTVGSANMDYRSMCLDGEAMVVVAGWESLNGVIDFMLLAGLCEWPETTEELDALLPPPSGLMRRISGLMKLML